MKVLGLSSGFIICPPENPLALADGMNGGSFSNYTIENISDCGWRDFLNMLDYKAVEAGSLVLEVNPAYTSQTCSKCGKIVKKELSERIHKCGACGLEMDRDLNASLNILRVGMDSLSNCKVTLEAHSL
jgi:transposase